MENYATSCNTVFCTRFFITLGEIWVTTSRKHSREFENKTAKDDKENFIISFKVKARQLIPQIGSKEILGCNNIFNNERIKNRPHRKYNIEIKGPKNVKLFNEATKELKVYRVTSASKNGGKRLKIVDAEGVELRSETSDINKRKKRSTFRLSNPN